MEFEKKMNRQSKQLTIRNETFVLTLSQGLDSIWECRLLKSSTNEFCIVRHALAKEAKYLSHVIAHDIVSDRQDLKSLSECETGWK